MINSKEDLIAMLAKRDHVTRAEAKQLVEVTQQLINECFDDMHSIEDIEDILAENLGIEGDYMFLFLW